MQTDYMPKGSQSKKGRVRKGMGYIRYQIEHNEFRFGVGWVRS